MFARVVASLLSFGNERAPVAILAGTQRAHSESANCLVGWSEGLVGWWVGQWVGGWVGWGVGKWLHIRWLAWVGWLVGIVAGSLVGWLAAKSGCRLAGWQDWVGPVDL